MTFTHQQDVQVLNQDIRHIQLDPTDFIPIERSKWKSFGWMLGFGVGPLGYAWMLALARRHRMERRDPRGARKKKAMRALNLALNQAQGVADVGEAMEQRTKRLEPAMAMRKREPGTWIEQGLGVVREGQGPRGRERRRVRGAG